MMYPRLLLCFPLLLSTAAAQSPIAKDLAAAVDRDLTGAFNHVLTDRPGDGRLWAHGRDWKMSFDQDGATYYPFFGSDAPRNYPVRFKLVSASVGGEALVLSPRPSIELTGQRVSIDHGPLIETYALAAGQVEQLFWLDVDAPRGELVIDLDVESELAGVQAAQGLAFTGELGDVSYSNAIAIDAEGAQRGLATRLSPTGITIQVPSDFVESAAWPLLIDPVITTVPVADTAFDAEDPDVAWDEGTARYAVVWERPFSAGDSDVYAAYFDEDGNFVSDSNIAVDFTSSNWTSPSVANAGATGDFLFAAERGNEGATVIWGRIRPASSSLYGPQFQISDLSGYEIHPAVGGDPGPTPSSGRFLVVWERVRTNGTDRDIYGRLIRADGTLLGQRIIINSSLNTDDRNPSISKSRGPSDWTVVWQRNVGTNNADILGARINSSGAITAPTFEIDTFGTNTEFPVVSSPLEDGLWLVAYRAFVINRWEVFCRLYSGNSTVPIDALTITANDGSPATSKSRPYLDASDSRFVVTYSEAQSSFDADVFSTTLFVDTEPTRDLQIEEGYVYLGGDAIVASPAPIVSSGNNSSEGQRFFTVWDQFNLFDPDNDIFGAVVTPPGPPNDVCVDAQWIDGTGIFSFETDDANTDGQPDACGTSGQVWGDVWYRWTSEEAGTYSLSTCGGTVLDTVIAIYPGGSCPEEGPEGCVDDSCGLQSQIVFQANFGEAFYFRIGAKDLGEEGSGSFRIQLVDNGMPGENYCIAAPNSVSASGATMGASGSTSVFANDLVLEASSLPPGVPGLFFFGSTQVQTPFGDGFRCAGGQVRRLYPLRSANASGNASYSVDNTAFPASELSAGLTAFFQFWYRDMAGGPNGFNLTDGLALTFVP